MAYKGSYMCSGFRTLGVSAFSDLGLGNYASLSF